MVYEIIPYITQPTRGPFLVAQMFLELLSWSFHRCFPCFSSEMILNNQSMLKSKAGRHSNSIVFFQFFCCKIQIGVSKNRGKTPQIIHLFIGFSTINHPFWWVFPPLFLVQHPDGIRSFIKTPKGRPWFYG